MGAPSMESSGFRRAQSAQAFLWTSGCENIGCGIVHRLPQPRMKPKERPRPKIKFVRQKREVLPDLENLENLQNVWTNVSKSQKRKTQICTLSATFWLRPCLR